MTEKGKGSPDPQVLIRNRHTGETKAVAPNNVASYLSTYASPNALTPMYELSSRAPGFRTLPDGQVEAVSLSAKEAEEAVRQQSRGNKSHPYSLAGGREDVRWEAAKQTRKQQVLRQRGQERSGARVAGERAADILTFGLYGTIADNTDEDRMIRQYANESHPAAMMVGTVGGVVGSMLMPVGALGNLGRGVAVTAKASRGARAAQAAKIAGSTMKTRNLLDVTARTTQAVRNKMLNAGFGPGLSGYAGGLAGAAVAEAPLSLAIAAADIVDYNKPFSAQALIADAGSLWLTGVGIAGVLGAPGAMFRGAAGMARRGAEAGIAAQEAAQAGLAKGAVNLGADIASGVAWRAAHRGGGMVMGPVKAALAQGAVRAGKSSLLRRAVKSPAARVLTGEAVQDFHKASLTFKRAVDAADAARYTAGADLRVALKDLQMASKSPRMAQTIQELVDNADFIVKSRQAYDIAYTNVDEVYTKAFNNFRYKAPNSVKYSTDASWQVERALKDIGLRLNQAKKMNVANPKAYTELSRSINRLSKSVSKRPKQAVEQLVQARQDIAKSGIDPSRMHGIIQDALETATLGDAQVLRQMQALDEFTVALKEIREGAAHVRNNTAMARRTARNFEEMRAAAADLNVDPNVLQKLTDDAGILNQPRIQDGAARWNQLNNMRAQMTEDAPSFFRTPADTLPNGPYSALDFNDEIMQAQLQSVMTFKQQTARALKFIAQATGPQAYATALSFGGVMAYRHMDQVSKDEAFSDAREIVLTAAKSPEMMIATTQGSAEKLAETDMPLAVQYSTSLATANAYLLQHMPRSADPLMRPTDLSSQEKEEFLERVGALDSVHSVLASCWDGGCSVEAVDTIRNVMPELYTDIVLDMIEFMNTPDADNLTQNALIGLDQFTGGALGVLDNYTPTMPLFAQTPTQQQSLGLNQQQASPQMAQQQAKMTSTPGEKVGAL